MSWRAGSPYNFISPAPVTPPLPDTPPFHPKRFHHHPQITPFDQGPPHLSNRFSDPAPPRGPIIYGYSPPPQPQMAYPYGQHQGGYPPYPPQQPGHSPYPPQAGPYNAPPGPPQHHPPQGQYGGPPPGQYPPPPQQQQHYPQHQQGGYGAPPPGYPPQGAYGAPPPPQQGYPPQGGYGGPPQPPQQYSPPAPPSPGYDPRQVANVDTSRDADELRSSMKGMGTDERKLIAVLCRIPDPVIMANVVRTYNQRHRRDLLSDIKSETGSYFGETCEAIVRGPLSQDIFRLHDAIKGAGTDEYVLDDVLLGRSNADMHAIKTEYHRVAHRALEQDVRDDLSMKTERLFDFVLEARRAEESAGVMQQDVDHCVTEIHRSTEGTKFGTDQVAVSQILASHSDGQIRVISQAFQTKYRSELKKVIEKEFSGHMEHALLRMLHCGEDRAMADAMALEECMKGAGTKDRRLLNLIVHLHWDKQHMGQVKGAYKVKYKQDLSTRIKGETRGDLEKILLALVG